MSLHPPHGSDFPSYHSHIVNGYTVPCAVGCPLKKLDWKPEPATRVIKQVWGMKVSAAHTRRPRILRIETSKARSGAYFKEQK